MKNLFSATFIAAAAVLLSGCTSGSKYVIEGSGDQLVDGHWVFLEDGADWTILDSALIENGAFRIEGADMGSEVAYLYMGANSAPSGLYQISGIFFLEPGTVTLEYVPDVLAYRYRSFRVQSVIDRKKISIGVDSDFHDVVADVAFKHR